MKRSRQTMQRAWAVAAGMVAMGEQSRQRIAEQVGVSTQTVTKWFPHTGQGRRGPPSITRTSHRGIERAARDAAWAQAWIDGSTLRQIGDAHGRTREYVRQRVMAHLGPTGVAIVKARNMARTNTQRAAAVHRRRMEVSGLSCSVCGDPLPDDRTRFCGDTCYERWCLLRYQIDPVYREKHRVLTAKWGVEHGDNYLKRHGARVLSGDATQRMVRWLVKGSMTYMVAVDALVHGWPIFDGLHPDVQAQIRADVTTDA